MAFLLLPLEAWAEAGGEKADRLCIRAEKAERDAGEAERKSRERERFLKGRGNLNLQGDTASRDKSIAIRQSVKAQIAQARAILPQLRQGAASASRDSGIAPGLSQYFSQMENNIIRALQTIETCLDDPEYCSAPSIYCPPPPNIPVYNKRAMSADMIRQIQQSYRQAANMAHQACLNLKDGVSRDIERLRQESQSARMKEGLHRGAEAQRFGETDLYLRRAESLRRQALQHRLEADRVSGIRGYCKARPHPLLRAEKTHALIEAFRASEKQKRKPETGLSPDAAVIDLKAGWNRKWNKGRVLKVPEVPPPKLQAGEKGATMLNGIKDYLHEQGPWWWYKIKSAYQGADEQVELTEFIRSRPKELAKDVVTTLVENSFGSFGRSLTTGYKIIGAVKTTAAEVGEILRDAPGVIVHGSSGDMQELAGRTDRVPLKTMDSLFGDYTGVVPAPRYKYQYERPAETNEGN